MKKLEVIEKESRNRSNSSLVSRTKNRSRSNSFKPIYQDSERSVPYEEPEKFPQDRNLVAGMIITPPDKLEVTELDTYKSRESTPKSVMDQDIRRVNTHKSAEESGILSSILNIAHNTASLMTHKDSKKSANHSKSSLEPEHADNDNYSSFSNKLDSLINDKLSDIDNEAHRDQSSTRNASATEEQKFDGLSPNNIHFDPVRQSPLNTMGNGDLSLNDFLDSRKDSLDPVNEESQQEKKVKDTSDSDSIASEHSKLKYASKKRNREFHQIFKKIPTSDRLIDDFSCALSKDILIQGKMYLSQHYICFKSNILGWVTNLRIPLQEVVQIEKKSTAVVFPNGMIVKTLHQKYTFATFISRDSTFELLTKVWHRVLLEREGGKVIHDDSDFESDISNFSEDSSDSDTDELPPNNSQLLNGYDRRKSSMSITNEVQEENTEQDLSETSLSTEGIDMIHSGEHSLEENSPPSDSQTFRGLPIIGPSTHSATSSEYVKGNNDSFIIESQFEAPLGVVFSLLFGKDNSYYIKILKDQKNFDIEEAKISGLAQEGDERNYKYTKPLGGSIGPKQTTCIITDKILKYNIDKVIVVEQATSTPEVPSGNAFKIRTKIHLHWGDNNSTKMYVITNIEWTGKSWLKGPIEKGSIEGQKDSMKILIDTVSGFIRDGESGFDKNSPKKKRKKSLKATEVKPTEQVTVEVKEQTFTEKLSDVVESVGKLVPIPIVPSLVVGIVLILLQLLVVIRVYNAIFHANQIQVINSSLMINNDKYYLIPSVENHLIDKNRVRSNEVKLWKWVNEKSGSPLDTNLPDYLREYKDQELKEVIRLAQLKIDHVNELLNQQ